MPLIGALVASTSPCWCALIIVVVPGRLPLCHQFPLPSSRTFQARAYFTGGFCGKTAAGVVISRTVFGFNKLGLLGKPPNDPEIARGRRAWRSIRRWESMRVTFIS
jgi:hypothetical protein